MIAGSKVVRWTPHFEIGVPELDRQHKFLFELVNELGSAVGKRNNTDRVLRSLDGIMTFLRLHDETEESIMREIKYRHAHDHANEHRQFHETLKSLYDCVLLGDLTAERRVRTRLKDWCQHHVGGSDRGLRLLLAGEATRPVWAPTQGWADLFGPAPAPASLDLGVPARAGGSS